MNDVSVTDISTESQGIIKSERDDAVSPSGCSALTPLSAPISPEFLSLVRDALRRYGPKAEAQKKRHETLAKKASKPDTDRRRRPDGFVVWRSLTEIQRCTRRLEAMKASGRCFPVTLILAPEIIKQAEALKREKPVQWLAARIKLRLNETLGREVDFLLADHHNKAGKLHLHGVIRMSDAEKPLVILALHKALGVFKRCKQQFRFSDNRGKDDPDSGWIGYMLRGQDKRHSIYSPHSITRRAKALHKKRRAMKLPRGRFKTS